MSHSSTSISSSSRTQPIQNPYLKSSKKRPSRSTSQSQHSTTTSQSQALQPNNTTSSQSSADTLHKSLPPTTTLPPHRSSSNQKKKNEEASLKNLRHALRDYTNNIQNNTTSNHNQDALNTSFSVASYTIRQRKLLRNVIFELKQISNLTRDYKIQLHSNYDDDDHRVEGDEDDDEEDNNDEKDYGGYQSFYLKGVGCNSNYETSFHMYPDIVEKILIVLTSVNKMIIEEYYEQSDESSSSNNNDHDLGMSYMNNNMNTTTIRDDHENHHHHNETILVALEFLNIAYSCLESNIVMTSLQTMIDCEEFHCMMDVTKQNHDNDDDNDDSSEGQHGDLRSVIDALLYFTLDRNGNGIIDINYDQQSDENDNNMNAMETQHHDYDNEMSFLAPPQSSSQTNTKWNPTRIQTLAMSALTKAILNTEFIQRYCTSLTILPQESIDSLLGPNMGIGLVDTYKDEMTQIVQMSMCYLSSLKKGKNGKSMIASSSSSITHYERKDREMFCMACMSLLSCLFRTNAPIWMLVEVPPRLTKKMIGILYHFVQDATTNTAHKKKNNKNNNKKSKCVLSTLAKSLLLVVEWKSPGSTMFGSSYNNIFDDQSIMRLMKEAFDLDANTLQHANSKHLLIHLCLIRDETLKKMLNDDQMLRIIKDQMNRLIVNDLKSNDYFSFYFLMVHFLQAFPRTRRILCKILQQNERDGIDHQSMYQQFFNVVLDFNHMKTFNALVGSTTISRAILSLEMRDELASKSKSLTSTLQLDTTISEMLKPYIQLRSKCIGTEKQLEVVVTVDFIGHLFRLGNQNAELLQQLNECDSIVQTILDIAKVYNESFGMNSGGNESCILCGLLFGATYILGWYCNFINDKGLCSSEQSKMKLMIGQFMRRFESNTMNDKNRENDESDHIACMNFAINQTSSRDLVRRALLFNSSFDSLYGEGEGRSMDVEIFAASSSKAALVSQSSEQHAIFEDRLENLTEQCEIIRRERDGLSQELLNKDAYFQQQLNYARHQSRSDAIEKAEVIAEERNMLELKLMSTRNELSSCQQECKEQKMESAEREDELKKKVDEVYGKNQTLEQELMKLQQTLQMKNEELATRDSKITQQHETLKDMQIQLDNERKDKASIHEAHIVLQQEHNKVKEKLEDALSKLISLAKCYVGLEQSSNEEVQQLQEKIVHVNNNENEVKRKYQRLKEVYHGAEEKIKLLNAKIEKLKSSYSQGSKSSSHKESKSSRSRQPMGTLAFMNSIHDTSIRLSGKEREKSHRRPSSKQNTSSSTSRSKTKSGSRSHRNIR